MTLSYIFKCLLYIMSGGFVMACVHKVVAEEAIGNYLYSISTRGYVKENWLVAFMAARQIQNSRQNGGMLFYSFLDYFLLEELVGPEKGQDVVRKEDGCH